MYLLTMWSVEVGVAINIMDKKVAINIWTHHFTRYFLVKPCRWYSESEITFAPITFRYSELSLSNSLDVFLFFVYSLFSSSLLLLLTLVVGSCLVTEKKKYISERGILRIGIYVLQSIKQVGEDWNDAV